MRATITSQHNRALKEIRKLRQRRRWRERSGRFVAEGEDLLAAADAAGWDPVERYCAAGSGLPGVEVEPELLAAASGLASGTRALAVYDERWVTQPLGPLCVYLHGVADPGNVGAVLRSAEAFGAACVVLGPGSADPYSPKAVRASMGAVFSVALTKLDGEGDPTFLPGAKIALVPGQGAPLGELWRFGSPCVNQNAKVRAGDAADHAKVRAGDAADHAEIGVGDAADRAEIGVGDARWPELTLLIGAERDGLPPALVEQADQVAHIPIETDSLNVAMAATVALYELATRMPRP